jgi:hypothetical protein
VEECTPLLNGAMKLFVGGTLRRGFDRWREYMAFVEEGRMALIHALVFFTHRALAAAWARWAEMINEKHELEAGAYTRSLLSSTSAVSNTKYALHTP